MSAVTKVAGYPPHRITQYTRWANQNGAKFTDWVAACGAQDQVSGHEPFKEAGQARRQELCRGCFPSGHFGHFPEPVEVDLITTPVNPPAAARATAATGANPVGGRRFVLAEKPGGGRTLVGPVYKDDSEAKLRGEIEAVGWRVVDVVAQLSCSDFRAGVR